MAARQTRQAGRQAAIVSAATSRPLLARSAIAAIERSLARSLARPRLDGYREGGRERGNERGRGRCLAAWRVGRPSVRPSVGGYQQG